MVNNVSPSPEALSTVNVSLYSPIWYQSALTISLQGIAQMGIIFVQAIAPALATALFAASIRSRLLAGNSIWVLLFAFGMLVLVPYRHALMQFHMIVI